MYREEPLGNLPDRLCRAHKGPKGGHSDSIAYCNVDQESIIASFIPRIGLKTLH